METTEYTTLITSRDLESALDALTECSYKSNGTVDINTVRHVLRTLVYQDLRQKSNQPIKQI